MSIAGLNQQVGQVHFNDPVVFAVGRIYVFDIITIGMVDFQHDPLDDMINFHK